jgi:integrase/recombinase XerD
MGYKGQIIKVIGRRKVKPRGFPRAAPPDPLAHLPLLAYMHVHLEAGLVAGGSEHTAKRSRVAIRRFITWCDERGLASPADITKQVLERYQRHLFYHRKADGKPLTLGAQAGCLNPLKAWFKWLARQNHILYNPASELDIPHPGTRLPRVILSVQEVEAILAEADVNLPAGVRDRALLETLYSTALRRFEAANLEVYDIDFSRRLLMVREGKGRRDRMVPIGERALAWLEKYVMDARPQLLTHDHSTLFVTDYGLPAPPELIADRVKKYMECAGIRKPGATHLLRHACATHMLEGGADIRFIQAMLGHSSLQTTEIYTHVAIDTLQAIHAATHPARLHRQAETAAPSESDREALNALLAADAAA